MFTNNPVYILAILSLEAGLEINYSSMIHMRDYTEELIVKPIPKNFCCWVIRPATLGNDAIYCYGLVSYKMVEDGGEPGAQKVRKYNNFCERHQAAADELDKEENMV